MRVAARLILMLLLLAGGRARAQAPDSVADWQTVLFEQPGQALPALLEAALRHAPELEAQQTEQSIAQADLRMARRALLNSIQLSGAYGYGNVANMTVTDPSLPRAYATTASSRYATAVNVNLPLDKLVNHRQLLLRQQLLVQQAALLTRARETAVRQRVIDQFQEVQLTHQVLTLRRQALLSAQLNYQLGEKQFRSGELTLMEMSQLTDRHAAALVEQETAANHLTTALLQLEELIGEKVADLLHQP